MTHINSYWQNKVCLITGGSSGLGQALAAAWSRQGARVIITARRQEPLEQVASRLNAKGGQVVPMVADGTWQEDVHKLLESIADRYGQLDLLCNCAGRSTRSPILETSADDFQQLLEVNLLATVRTTRAAAKLLLASGGHVVNIGSLASKVAPRYMGAYPAAKFAVAAYSQQLRLELGPQGLHVLLVCPGPIARSPSVDSSGAESTGPGNANSANPSRYASPSTNLPDQAHRPGGGAKVKLIDPDWLAEKILIASQRRRSELVVPAKARLLFTLSQISPRLGDWLLLRAT
jgi:NAD(P)-dependent dehydrogenase (short-subunit alcohol dehydrogenase family)